MNAAFLLWLAWYHALTGNVRAAAESVAAAAEVNPW